MRFSSLFSFVIFFTVAVFSAAQSTEEHPVTVRQNPPKITRRQFDPARPPAQMPKLTPPESGVCHYEFTCNAGMAYLIDTIDPRTVEVEVDSVDMILDLPIDIWVARGSPPKLAQHEEGHRQIAEDYYKGADAVARELGKKMIGKKAKATGRNKQEAQTNAQQKLLSELNDAFMAAVRVRCRICEDHYDDITNHSLKPIAEADAIVQAKALEKAGKIPSVGLPKDNGMRSIPKN